MVVKFIVILGDWMYNKGPMIIFRENILIKCCLSQWDEKNKPSSVKIGLLIRKLVFLENSGQFRGGWK